MPRSPTRPASARRDRPRGPVAQTIAAHRGPLLGATVLRGGHQLGEAGVPVIVGAAVGSLAAGGAVASLLIWIAVLGADFLLLSLSYRFGARLTSRAKLGIAHELRMRVVDRAIHPGGGLDSVAAPGELLSIATSDARRVGDSTGWYIAAVVSSLVVVASIAGTALASPLLAGVVLVAAVIVLLVLRRLSAPLEARSADEQQETGTTTALASDLLEGLRVITGLGAEDAAAERYRRQSRRSLAHTVRAAALDGRLSGLTLSVVGIYLAVVAAVCGALAAAGTIGVGELIAILGLAQFVLGPLQTLGGVWPALARARASATRLERILAVTTPARGTAALEPRAIRGAVSLEGVDFEGLLGVDLDSAPGELHGIVTGSPAHARALVRLFGGDSAPDAGRLTLDGRASTEIAPGSWRASVLVPPHDAALFGDDLDEAYRPAGAPAASVDAAIAAAAVAELLERHETGADAPRKDTLSGGEHQRLVLARALAAEPPVLVLHDPTTAVDSVTEAAIAVAVRELRAGRTTIVIGSSPAFLQFCDRVTFIDGGRVIATGRHAQLAESLVAYRETVLR